MLRPPSSHPAAGRPRIAGRLLAGCATIAGCVLMAGCGVPPELDQGGSTTPTKRPTPTALATSAPVGGIPTLPAASTPTASNLTAVSCAGKPSGEQVIALLRRSADLLPRGARTTVPVVPLCAGDWQYSVVQIPGREPLQVVSRGPAGALKLVTAGTDVCTIEVRTAAPPGIRTAACEAGPLPTGAL